MNRRRRHDWYKCTSKWYKRTDWRLLSPEGVLNTSRLMGGALGLVILSTVASSQTKSDLGVSAARAMTHGFDIAFLVAAAFCLTTAVVAATRLRPRTTEVAALPDRREIDEREAVAA
jgi:hypothetical protein